MPELPEVETVRRMLERHVTGRRIAAVEVSGAALRGVVPRRVHECAAGRVIQGVGRHGKFLFIGLEGGWTLLSHLGMSGRWLFHARPPADPPPHVHVRMRFEDGCELWYEDPRRFGALRAVETSRLAADPSVAALGPDPVHDPPTGARLAAAARGLRVAVKNFLLDQRRLAGVGNIYASEALHRAGVDPRRRAGALTAREWDAVAREVVAVLRAAIERMGTTFSMYRTLWGEPGGYGNHLRVYDREGAPCRRCRTPIRRIVQGQRSTYFCPSCQSAGRSRSRTPRKDRKLKSRRRTAGQGKPRTGA
uniref:Formamidopyrimidine-DNA glycosylase n=1 Tax=Eiseniibacteriota bacterium TaxID=2212470 RepID=A0A832I513_UNCEI